MADVADLVDRPQLRCFAPDADRRGRVCAQPAVWMEPPVHGIEAAYFCDRHRTPACQPIAADAVFRRVSLDVEVRFAGSSMVPAVAHAEAFARLEAAVLAAGGTLSVGRVTSVVGRLRPPAPLARQRQAGGDT